MNATKKRLCFALLFAAGAIIFNVYMVLTGAAGDFYGHAPGTAPHFVAQAAFQGRINSHTSLLQMACRSNRPNSCRGT
jgi:hypothetical protein